jgi:drug/metabolite transporter (DMT)-like permease
MSTRISTPALIAGLATLYIVWGSTYLAMNWAVRGFPPFFVASFRALCAGGLLYAIARARGAPRPDPVLWRNAAVVGGLLLLLGNGLVTFASQHVPSGLIALLLALLPAWMAVLGPLYARSERVRRPVWLGIAVGLAGVALLIGPQVLKAFEGREHTLAERWRAIGIALSIISCFCWANGSLISRRVRKPDSPMLGIGMQLLAGGGLLALASLLTGEWPRLSPAQVAAEPRAALAVVYLMLFGTLLGYSVYIWLLHRTSGALVSTYAYVNPVIAVALGVGLNGERMTPRMLLAAAAIIAGVVVIVTFGQRGGQRA